MPKMMKGWGSFLLTYEFNQHELNTYCVPDAKLSTLHTLFKPHLSDLGIIVILHFTVKKAV